MDKNTIRLFSSRNSDEYSTPQDRFNDWNKEFNFTLDVCASELNAKCDAYYDIHSDSLKQNWIGNCWCNPPYSKIKQFLQKGSEEIRKAHCNLIVFLTFVNTDTRWFWQYVYDEATNQPWKGIEIRFIKGRLKFGNENLVGHAAMRPSMLIIMQKVTP